MPDETLERRLAAVERAVSDTDGAGDPDTDRTELADRLEALEADVAELEAAVQAVRGYVGSVKHVNDEVEQRADAAMAKAQAVERTLEADRRDGATSDRDEHPPADRSRRSPTDQGQRSPASRDDRPSGDHGELSSGQCPRCGDGTASGTAGGPSGGGSEPPSAGVRDERVADGGSVADGGGVPGSTEHWPAAVGHRSLGGRDEDDPDDDGDGLLARLREVL